MNEYDMIGGAPKSGDNLLNWCKTINSIVDTLLTTQKSILESMEMWEEKIIDLNKKVEEFELEKKDRDDRHP